MDVGHVPDVIPTYPVSESEENMMVIHTLRYLLLTHIIERHTPIGIRHTVDMDRTAH